jgi:hypothetical protein
MAQRKSRVAVGFGVTNPVTPLEMDLDVWEQVRTLLLLDAYEPLPHKKGKPLMWYQRTVENHPRPRWHPQTVCASDLNRRFRHDGYHDMQTMQTVWNSYTIPQDIIPEDVFRALIGLLHLASTSQKQYLVSQEKS